MVIGIHTYVDGLMHFNLFLRQFLNCAVPIFLAISGYFIGRKSFEEKGSYSRFLRKQIPRVYYPMLIWSIPWVLLSVKAGHNPLLTMLKAFAGEMSIFYFIMLIMQYYILTPAIQRLNNKFGGLLRNRDIIRHILVRLCHEDKTCQSDQGAVRLPIHCLDGILCDGRLKSPRPQNACQDQKTVSMRSHRNNPELHSHSMAAQPLWQYSPWHKAFIPFIYILCDSVAFL